jgi:hypothetical protein
MTPTTRVEPAATLANVVTSWGLNNVNLHDLYDEMGEKVGDRNAVVPGIYVICGCTQFPPEDARCTACHLTPDPSDVPHYSVKVGLARNLADRIDDYHTTHPHGLRIMRLYILLDADKQPLDASTPQARSTIDKLLAQAENYILNRMRGMPFYFRPVDTTRPGFMESFKVIDMKKFDNMMVSATQWTSERLAEWQKRNPGEDPGLTHDRFKIYEADGVQAVLVPYGRNNILSVAGTRVRRHGEDATLLVTADQSYYVNSHQDWMRIAGRIRRANRALQLSGGCGCMSGGGYSTASGTYGMVQP